MADWKEALERLVYTSEQPGNNAATIRAHIEGLEAQLSAALEDRREWYAKTAERLTRAEAAERDARRWQFARRRLKLQHQRTLAGGMRPAMDIRPAWSVLRGGDPGAGYLEPTRFEKECDELDAAIDAAIATTEQAAGGLVRDGGE